MSESPQRYEGDLRLSTLVREVAAAWDHDPIARRLWTKARGWVAVIFFTTILANSMPLLLSFPSVTRAVMGIRNMVFFIGWTITFCSLTAMLLLLFAHLRYPQWAYRRVWRDDEMLRLVDLTPRQRFIGMMAPFIRAGLFIAVIGILARLMQFAFGTIQLSLLGQRSFLDSTLSVVAFMIACMSEALTSAFVHGLIAGTLALRLAVAYAHPSGRKAFPYWKSILGWVALTVIANLLRSLAFWFREWVGRSINTPIERERLGRAFGYYDVQFITTEQAWDISMLFFCLWEIAIGAVFILTAYLALRSLWRRDIPIAREYLFRADDDQTRGA